MATLLSFQEIEAWRGARELSRRVYDLSRIGSFSKDFGLKDQINRSTGSVMDNIAEGFERDGSREFIQFLSVSKGSLGETQSQLCRALDRGHISQQEFDELLNEACRIGKQIGGLMTYLKQSGLKGNKFDH